MPIKPDKPIKKKRKPASSVALLTSAMRRVWSWSPVRKEALKRAGYNSAAKGGHCEECGDQCDKPEVHHNNQCHLYTLAKQVAEKLFPPVEELTVVCKSCHAQIHREDK